ncbi:tRNA:m(4)X modification enzyme TRM13 homolog isoform X2 [Vespa velutina]|uniref:tRNA:m(4)X modification enzyme TRM13 homolog isoform X2 n=1 Tax=Vespa velutina TaxID=202808 RepID=UPI001FB2158B|nr:tRNA:m(4)X modification enzyme TRM13 homolog isoform X2 [Vespa velutina]
MDEEPSKCCMYFVKRKNRYCHMTVKRGNKFCGEHQQDSLNSNDLENTEKSNKRIKCPLDPTHTCYESKLSKHLTICNARKMLDARPTYIVQNVNLDEETEEIPRLLPLSQLDFSVVDAIIKRIDEAYEKLPEISKAILHHDILKDALTISSCGKYAKKHLTQNSSLLAHLEKAELVKNNTCYIEFGAGKDLAIRCLIRAIDNKSSGSNYGLVIAFCCHHKCEYKSYIGKEYLEQCKFLPKEFPILCSIASWATCGFNLKTDTELKDENKKIRFSKQNVRSIERELIGNKVKTLLNWGRLEYLRNIGFEGSLFRYISSDISLENMCIVAKYSVT